MPTASTDRRAEADVRIRLTLALSGSPGRGDSEVRVRGSPNPVTYLTKNCDSTPYRRLPTPMEIDTSDDVRSAIRDWENLSRRTEQQLALGTAAPAEEPKAIDFNRDLVSSSRVRSLSISSEENRGALVPFFTDGAMVTPYRPEPTRVARPFRAAEKLTASAEKRLNKPQSTPESRAKLFKSAIAKAPSYPPGYQPSEVTVENRGLRSHFDAESEYAETVFGSTALSPLDYEEQKEVIDEEARGRDAVEDRHQRLFGELQHDFYKGLMQLSMFVLSKSFGSEMEEALRAKEKQHISELAEVAAKERAKAAAQYWDLTLRDRIRATHLPVVHCTVEPLDIRFPARPQQSSWASTLVEDIRAGSLTSLSVAGVDQAYTPTKRKPTPRRQPLLLESKIRSVPLRVTFVEPLAELYISCPPVDEVSSMTEESARSTPSINIPHERLWVDHHVEEDEMTTFAVAPPVRDEDKFINEPPPKVIPTPIADEEEYIPPPPQNKTKRKN